MSSGKEFVAAFKQQVGPAAEAYYKKVQGDYASTIQRADRLQRQIDALIIRKLAYSRKGKGSQNDAQNRLLSTLIRTQTKTGDKVKRWNEKAVNELRKIVKGNNALNDKALNALKGSSGTFNLAARAETSDEFIGELDNVLKGAKIIPGAGEGKKVGFDAIFAYSIAREKINSDDRIPDQTKATITKQIDERAAKYFKQMRPELSEAIPNEIDPSALIDTYAPYRMSERDIQVFGKDENYIKRLAPSLTDKPEGEDHSRMIRVLERKLGLDGSAEDIQIPGPSASLEDKQAFLSGALKTDGKTVEFDDSQSPQVQEATRKLLSEQGVSLPISYTKYVQSAGVVASSLNPKKAEADYDREIQRLKDRQNRLYEVAARRGDVSKGQLASLMHPILPVAGFRDALNVSMPLEEMYPGLYMEAPAATSEPEAGPPEQDIEIQTEADDIRLGLTDEELMAEDEEDDDYPPSDPGVPVMAAVVNRFKDASSPNNDIDPKDLIDDFNQLPDDLRRMFPEGFVLALFENIDDGSKGSDDPATRKSNLQKLIVQYGGQLDAIAAEDDRRVSHYIGNLPESEYPSIESNQVIELLNFLDHPGSLAAGETVDEENLQAKVLGSAGSKLKNQPFGNVDEVDLEFPNRGPDAGDEMLTPPPMLPSILAEARDSVASRPRSGLTSAYADPSGANVDLIRMVTGGALSGKPMFETAAVPEVTGTTTAAAPDPATSTGSRMAYTGIDDVGNLPRDIRDQLPGGTGDESAIAVRTPPPDVDLGEKPEPQKTREELLRPGGAMALDEYMAGKTEEEAQPKPKAAPKPTMGDIAFQQSADQIKVDTDSKPAVNISPEALEAWDSKVASLASYAIKQGGRNFGQVVQELRETANSMGLPEDLSYQAEENIFYLTDVGQSDPSYQEYLARQNQEPASAQTAGGFETPKEGGDPNKKLDYGYTEEEARDVLAEDAEIQVRMPYAVRPTDPDMSGNLVITSMYGYRGGDMHQGIDLRARNLDQNTNVYTVMDGTVSKVDNDPTGSAGRYVFVNHDNDMQTRYFHGDSIPERIQPGFKVQAGDMIMVAGQSGNSRGPHLHFEIGKISNGEFIPMDPMKALPDVFGQYVLDDDLMLQSTF